MGGLGLVVGIGGRIRHCDDSGPSKGQDGKSW